MTSHRYFPATALAVVFLLTSVISSLAQTSPDALTASTPIATSAPTAVPPLVPYESVALGLNGKPLTGETSITFLIFKDKQGGEPLFTETQTVVLDTTGHYKAQLGATYPSGLPSELFSTGEARWLEVQIAGDKPQPRILLASVPYALKAADAATLGGLPASAFALARTAAATTTSPQATPEITPDVTTTVTTTGGGAGYVPMFSGASTIVNSNILQSANGIGIGPGLTGAATTLDVNGASTLRGDATLLRAGNPTTAAGTNSYQLIFSAGAYDSATSGLVKPSMQWRAEPKGNNTASPSATLNLLSSNGVAPVAETGFFINPNGTLNFAPGQTFPGTGVGTITGVTAASPLTGGGTSGSVALGLNTASLETTLNAVYPRLSASNTFTGNQTVTGNFSASGTISSQGAGSFGTSGTANNGVSGKGIVTGVSGQATSAATNSAGVSGFEGAATGQVYGVTGSTNSATNFAAGVYGSENSTTGQVDGVVGFTASTGNGAAGVNGYESATSGQVYGVYGSTTSSTSGAAGVSGLDVATAGQVYGVFGQSNSTSGNGVNGVATATSGFANGVYGSTESPNGTGVFGQNNATSGVANGVQGQSTSPNGNGVLGQNNATTGFAVGVTGITNSSGGAGINGFSNSAAGGIGVFGASPTNGTGVQGVNQVCSTHGCTPVAGTAGLFETGTGGTILQGTSGSSFTTEFLVDAAGNGFFGGNLNVTGKLTKGSGSFKIDDPLDPANKYLSHSFVESPDMMNVYNGNVTTDKHGRATVELPEYFEALNRDFRYQLTVMGQFAQAIVAQEIGNNRFVIRTNKPSVKVSWQVSGIRRDAYANSNRIPVEEEKPAEERGYYLHPEAFGQPASKGIVAAHGKSPGPATTARLTGGVK